MLVYVLHSFSTGFDEIELCALTENTNHVLKFCPKYFWNVLETLIHNTV